MVNSHHSTIVNKPTNKQIYSFLSSKLSKPTKKQNMKVFICLAAFVAVASAGHLGGYGAAPAHLVETGSSSQFRSEDNYGNYNFGYDESHSTGGSSRRESQVNGVRHGSYSLSDADGRRRQVNYVADAAGFRATIDTNEPGVEPKDPAAVAINKNGYGPVAVAAPAYAAPVVAAYAPAPVVRAQVYRDHVVEAPIRQAYGPVAAYGGEQYAEAPRAFSYSFGATHVSPVAAPAYAAPAYAAPAPVYQQHTAGY